MTSVTETVRGAIRALPKGSMVTSAKFLGLGMNRAAVDQALCRLVRSGYIRRLARGIFVKPKKSPHVGEVSPGARQIAEHVTKRRGHRIQIHGAEAARRFGLTTQVPVQPIFLTNGPFRTIKIGNTAVKLKHVEERKLGPKNSRAGEAISLLWYLGKKEVNPKVLEKIRRNLNAKELEEFYEAIPMMPTWMSNQLHKARLNQQNG